MSGETTVTPGKTHDVSQGEKTDLAKINLVSKPSVRVNEQSIGAREMIDGSITADKLSQGVLDQINADAVISDGSVTCAKMAAGGVCYTKRDQAFDDNMIRRDTPTTTVGSLIRYSTTDGITEEVTAAAAGLIPSELVSGTDRSPTSGSSNTINVTTAKTLAAANKISGTVMFSGGPNNTFQNPCIANFNFVKIAGAWNYNIIVGTGGSTLTYPAGDSASDSGQNTVAAVTINHGTGVTTNATVTLTVTITDNDIESDLSFNGTAFYNHSVVAEVY
jgi:hypothetical protein